MTYIIIQNLVNYIKVVLTTRKHIFKALCTKPSNCTLHNLQLAKGKNQTSPEIINFSESFKNKSIHVFIIHTYKEGQSLWLGL